MSKLDNAAQKLVQTTVRSPVHLRLLGVTIAGSLYAAEAGARAIEPVAPLQSYFTADDYPADALAKEEQGTVEFLLSIAVDGQPTDCVVTNSSGSSSLDSATCLIMMERARFRPLRNAAGKPAINSYRSRISWRLEDTGSGQFRSPVVKTVTSLWFACSWGETAKLVTSELTAAEIATRALTVCAPLEERSAVEMRKASQEGLDPVKMIPVMKKEMAKTLAAEVDRSRAGLRGEGVE